MGHVFGKKFVNTYNIELSAKNNATFVSVRYVGRQSAGSEVQGSWMCSSRLVTVSSFATCNYFVSDNVELAEAEFLLQEADFTESSCVMEILFRLQLDVQAALCSNEHSPKKSLT